MVNNMATFNDRVSKYYIVGRQYKSLTSGKTRKLVRLRLRPCEDAPNCHGKFGVCDGTQLIFDDGITGCIYSHGNRIRFELVTPVGLKSNMRW